MAEKRLQRGAGKALVTTGKSESAKWKQNTSSGRALGSERPEASSIREHSTALDEASIRA